ncbi:MAG TPA: O-antigen ligase family protein [Fimbriimonadales bacterium]|nr:O-antigen ligase family protein [Fimbriimonadales bacterium]
MSIQHATVTISRFFEEIFSGQYGRKRALGLIIALAGVCGIAATLLYLFEADMRIVIAFAGISGFTLLVLMMVSFHEWLILLAILVGHSVFYGKPPALGLRIYNAIGPGDVFWFVAFICAITYWYGQKDAPRFPPLLFWIFVALASYTVIYIMIAFFFWKIRDIALVQAVGWLYFSVAFPTYYCLTTGRIWKPFYLLLLLTLYAAGTLAAFAELGVFEGLINRTGFGGIEGRTWGDDAVKTEYLGMGVTVTLIAFTVMAFARKITWRYYATGAFLSGVLLVFVDRGRVHYLGLVLALVLLCFFIPTAGRLRATFYAFTAILVTILIIQAIGGTIADKFNRAVAVAQKRVELSTPEAIKYDPGLLGRERLLREGYVIFKENPLFGGGPGTIFGYRIEWTNWTTVPLPFVDNSWLYPLAVVGIVGFSGIMLVYLSFIGANIWALQKLRNPLHRALAGIPMAFLVGFLLPSSFVTWWLVDRFHVAAYSIGVAVALALVYHEKKYGSDIPVVEF